MRSVGVERDSVYSVRATGCEDDFVDVIDDDTLERRGGVLLTLYKAANYDDSKLTYSQSESSRLPL